MWTRTCPNCSAITEFQTRRAFSKSVHATPSGRCKKCGMRDGAKNAAKATQAILRKRREGQSLQRKCPQCGGVTVFKTGRLRNLSLRRNPSGRCKACGIRDGLAHAAIVRTEAMKKRHADWDLSRECPQCHAVMTFKTRRLFRQALRRNPPGRCSSCATTATGIEPNNLARLAASQKKEHEEHEKRKLTWASDCPTCGQSRKYETLRSYQQFKDKPCHLCTTETYKIDPSLRLRLRCDAKAGLCVSTIARRNDVAERTVNKYIRPQDFGTPSCPCLLCYQAENARLLNRLLADTGRPQIPARWRRGTHK